MEFKPGQSGNPAGRPVNSINEATARGRRFINRLLGLIETRMTDDELLEGVLKNFPAVIAAASKTLPKDINLDDRREDKTSKIAEAINNASRLLTEAARSPNKTE